MNCTQLFINFHIYFWEPNPFSYNPTMSQETWAWFKSFTTISGLGQTFASTEKHWKGLWGILTLSLIILTGYSVIQTLSEYFAFEVTTSFSIGKVR